MKSEDNQPPRIAIILDDMNGIINKTSKTIVELFSRYRHYNIQCLVYAAQSLRGAPPVTRAMATAVILSKPNSDMEKAKILEEWGGSFQSRLEDAWVNHCITEQYEFCYLKLDEYEKKIFRLGKRGLKQIDWQKCRKTYGKKFITDT